MFADFQAAWRLLTQNRIAMYSKALVTVATITEALAPPAEINRVQQKFYRRMFLREVPRFLH